ncbi:MAG: GNAT family N-acetyltransferase [Paenibacillus sp.]|nr:GNAT family N-acetyltransferase [Paenibacillus sp.]
MGITFRTFKDGDIEKISKALGKSKYEFNNIGKVTWDCFSKHPCFEMFHPEKIGIWEDDGDIIGRVSLDSPWYGDAIIYVNPEYAGLCPDLLQYAESTFAGTDDNGKRYLNIGANEGDVLQASLEANGYTKGDEGRTLVYSLSESIQDVPIPVGFEIKSLQEVYNFKKLNDLLWRAFNYEGEPPAYDDDVYLPIKHAWLDYRQEICSVAVAPDGSYASFCGMWFDSDTKAAFIEPLVTAEKYRQQGLAKACIYESMKKCKELGADIIFVAPDEEPYRWYKSIGFKQISKSYCWSKSF